jgi:hypothetical protein
MMNCWKSSAKKEGSGEKLLGKKKPRNNRGKHGLYGRYYTPIRIEP